MRKEPSKGKIKIVQYGLGPIGIECAKVVLQRENLRLVGGIDVAEDKVGKDLGDLLGTGKTLGIIVSTDAVTTLRKTKPHVVLHTTQSFVPKVYDQLRACIAAGANVISSTEELFWPTYRSPDLSGKIDRLAKKYGVTVLGTGVNPGFVMDTLVACVTGVCTHVKKIRATRVVDASKRRLPLQKKVGAGLTPEGFRKLVDEGKLGHIGLVESCVAVAETLGWKFDQLQETIDPMIAEEVVQTPFFKV